MSRHHPDPVALDPAVAGDLRRLDAALAGLPSAEPALLSLVGDVRAQAPGPAPTFRRDLDARVASGFRRDRGPRAWAAAAAGRFAARVPRSRPALLPALGLLATVIVALIVSVAVLRDEAGVPGPGSGSAPSAGRPAAALDAGAGSGPESAGKSAAPAGPPASALSTPPTPLPAQSGVVVPQPAPGAGVAGAGAGPRKVEQSTRLALTTRARALQEVADGIVRVTQSAGGVVQQSDVEATDRGGTASFVLGVPSARAQDTVRRLSALAHVASMSQSATDITEPFASAAGRLGDARAERRALLRALDAARTPAGIARLRERIRVNRAEIAGLQGQVRGLRRRADTTVITVALTAHGGARVPAGQGVSGGGPWTPRDAARDALRILETGLGALLVALAVAVPVGLVAAPGLFAARATRRRRREHALRPA